MRHRQSHAPGTRLALAELDQAADLERLERREPQPHPGDGARRARATPSLQTSITQAPSCRCERRPRRASAARACARCAPPRPARTGRAARARRGTPTSSLPGGEHDPELGMRLAQPRDLLDERRAPSRGARAAERALQRAAQVAQRRPAARRSRARAPRRGSGASLETTSSTPNSRWITPSCTSRARSIRSCSWRARACWNVAWRAASASADGLAERPQQVALLVGQRPARAAVGEDHAAPAPAGRERAADERRRRRAGRGSARAPRARPPRRPSRSRGPRRAPGARSAPTRR